MGSKPMQALLSSEQHFRPRRVQRTLRNWASVVKVCCGLGGTIELCFKPPTWGQLDTVSIELTSSFSLFDFLFDKRVVRTRKNDTGRQNYSTELSWERATNDTGKATVTFRVCARFLLLQTGLKVGTLWAVVGQQSWAVGWVEYSTVTAGPLPLHKPTCGII
jgi:hypothetical protein